jgi:hypothetical protein
MVALGVLIPQHHRLLFLMVLLVGVFSFLIISTNPGLGLIILILSLLFKIEIPLNQLRSFPTSVDTSIIKGVIFGVPAFLLLPQHDITLKLYDIIALMLVAILTLRALMYKPGYNNKAIVDLKSFNIVFLLYLITILLSFLKSDDLINALRLAKNYLIGILVFYLTVNIVRDKKHLNLCFDFLILWTTALAAVEIYNALTYPDGLLTFLKYKVAFTGAGGSNTIASYYIMTIPVIIGWIRHKERKKIVYPLLFILVLAAFFMTLSKGGILGLVGGLLIASIIAKAGGYIRVKPIVLAISVLLLAGSIITVMLINMFTYDSFSLMEGRSSLVRLGLWKTALLIFYNNPVLGAGLGNSEIGGRIHNWPLQIAYVLGAAGLTAFVLLLIAIYRNLIGLWKKAENYSGLVFGFVISFLAILIQGMVEPSFTDVEKVSILFWFVMGLSFSLRLLIETERSEGSNAVAEYKCSLGVEGSVKSG